MKVFLPLKVKADFQCCDPSSPLFESQLGQTKVRAIRREIQGEPAGTFRGMYLCPCYTSSLPLLLHTVAEVFTCVLVVVNEAILNTVMKRNNIYMYFNRCFHLSQWVLCC